jgi:hypothetical protein
MRFVKLTWDAQSWWLNQRLPDRGDCHSSYQYGLAFWVSSGQLSVRKGVAGKPAPL